MDQALFFWIYSRRSRPADFVSIVISGITEYAMLWILVTIGLFIVGERMTAIAMWLALVLAMGVSYGIIRPLVRRARPYAVLPDIQRLGFTWVKNAFPSGHLASSSAMLTTLGMYQPSTRLYSVAFLLTLMWSRIYNGMHWPTDVVAGLVVGCLAGIASFQLMPIFFG